MSADTGESLQAQVLAERNDLFPRGEPGNYLSLEGGIIIRAAWGGLGHGRLSHVACSFVYAAVAAIWGRRPCGLLGFAVPQPPGAAPLSTESFFSSLGHSQKFTPYQLSICAP